MWGDWNPDNLAICSPICDTRWLGVPLLKVKKVCFLSGSLVHTSRQERIQRNCVRSGSWHSALRKHCSFWFVRHRHTLRRQIPWANSKVMSVKVVFLSSKSNMRPLDPVDLCGPLRQQQHVLFWKRKNSAARCWLHSGLREVKRKPLLVTRGEERSSEALIEAWAASVMTSEHLEVAVKDRTASRNWTGAHGWLRKGVILRVYMRFLFVQHLCNNGF